MSNPIFSIIVPTRKRLYGLKRLLKSFVQATFHYENLEVILVVDNDDASTINFYQYESAAYFFLKIVIAEPGLSMGALNMAGYEVSEGRYIMLLNDDVIVQTAGWDEKVLREFQKFPDDVCLVHVNDLTFGEKLCVFPFVTRKYCELAGGICRRDYIRYRIDDHIHQTFEWMAAMGKRRIVYLPEVIFEHTNFVFDAAGNRQYFLNGNILPHDAKLFDDLLPERRRLAIKLIGEMGIEADGYTNELSLLGEDLLNKLSEPALLPETPPITVGIVTANIMSWYAQAAINLIKNFTKNFDLIALDNNGQKPFNHARKMNQIRNACETDFLVLMDDDVFVELGWLEGLLRCINDKVAVVTPMHKDKFGKLSYAGVRMQPNYTGFHDHILTVPTKPRKIQTLCSAMMLIDMRKCRTIPFSDEYRKYFLDIDYGLDVWDRGFEVVCSPYATVTHLGGATMQQGGQEANGVWPIDHAKFVENWMDSGDYRQLEQSRWRGIEFST